jgi:hypothetical protein
VEIASCANLHPTSLRTELRDNRHVPRLRLASLIAFAATLALAVSAAGLAMRLAGPAPKPAKGAAPWPAPAGPLRLAVAAGLQPERKETLIHHVHSHLDVFVNGKPIRVPAGIGINIHDRGVKTFAAADGSKAYGGINLCNAPCISPLHTHDRSGILHTESASSVPNRLGQFFIEWGVALTPTCVGGYCGLASPHVYVNGKLYAGDPRGISLTDRKEIAIVIGTPPKRIPSTADFSSA